MRDFAVLVRESTYDVENDKLLTNLENINVLVGPKSAVEKVKTEIEKFLEEVKGSFKVNWRVQTM